MKKVHLFLGFPAVTQMQAEAKRQQRSLSWIAQQSWRIAKRRMERLSSLTELRGPKGAA